MTDDLLKQLLSLPSVSYAQISPDGRWVAFEWYRVREKVDVYIVPSNGSAPPKAIGFTDEDTHLISWSADSSALVVSEDHDGDEHARLYRVGFQLDKSGALQIGVLKPLTAPSPEYFVRGGSLSPDGNKLYFGANYDFSTNQVLEATWIIQLNLQNGSTTVLGKPRYPAFTRPELNLAGNALIYARKDRHPSGRQFHLIDIEKQEDTEILNFGDQEKVFAHWFPDSENILVISEKSSQGDQMYNRLGVYHAVSKDLRWLSDDPALSLETAWVTPAGDIIADRIVESNHQPLLIKKPMQGWHANDVDDISVTPFPIVNGNFHPLGQASDGAWLAIHYSSQSPIDLIRFRKEDMPVFESLTRCADRISFSLSDLISAQDFRWKSEDGLEVQGWLYRAHTNYKKAIIYIHGGPSSHSEDKLNPEIQYFVSCGFNVLDVNYRGSTGFGLRFRELIKEDGWGGREQSDIASGAKALIENGFAQPGKVGVTGTSYGGYSSWFLITHYPKEIIAAAAPICGMTDLVIDYETTRPDLRPYSEEMMGGNPQQAPQRYHERSPIHFVENIRGKLLIVQGAKDPNVTPRNLYQVKKRLAAHQIPFDVLIFDDEGHGIKKPSNQKILYARLKEFFESAFAD